MSQHTYDLIPKIIFNCAPCRNGRLHPCVAEKQDERTRKNTHQRRIADINKVVIYSGKCRMNKVLHDSKVAWYQRNHVVIDKRGVAYVLMPPDRYVGVREEYRIFLEGDFEEPMPREQREALRYILNGFDALCKQVPVFLESDIRERAVRPGPFLDAILLNDYIFPVDWSTDRETWVEK